MLPAISAPAGVSYLSSTVKVSGKWSSACAGAGAGVGAGVSEGAGVGVGDYLPVTGGLSMNGIQGATATLTADDGTVLKFVGGVLVEAEPVALEE